MDLICIFFQKGVKRVDQVMEDGKRRVFIKSVIRIKRDDSDRRRCQGF